MHVAAVLVLLINDNAHNYSSTKEPYPPCLPSSHGYISYWILCSHYARVCVFEYILETYLLERINTNTHTHTHTLIFMQVDAFFFLSFFTSFSSLCFSFFISPFLCLTFFPHGECCTYHLATVILLAHIISASTKKWHIAFFYRWHSY